jgi:hypothetical protein
MLKKLNIPKKLKKFKKNKKRLKNFKKIFKNRKILKKHPNQYGQGPKRALTFSGAYYSLK